MKDVAQGSLTSGAWGGVAYGRNLSSLTMPSHQGNCPMTPSLRVSCPQGQAARAVAGHGLNARSSRSHTVFTLVVETAGLGARRPGIGSP